MMKILQLTNYPTSKPQHGGQLRASHIADELRRAGHDVKSVAVYVASDYQPDSKDDIAFTAESSFWRDDLLFLSDYLTGLYATDDENAFAALGKITDEQRPDVIMSEQPWLMAAARKLAETRPSIKLVYSSQNVESRLKRGVLEKTQIAQSERKRLVAVIETLERDAVAAANLVIACTDADAAYYRDDVLDCREVVVAGNGVEPFSCKQGRVEAWRRFFDSPFPVFVSSAHPPNASGFWDMMAPGLTFLRPEERVLIVGGVSDLILQMKGFDEFCMINRDRMEIMGRMEKNELQAVVSAAHVVLLPIAEGEGSNLKTAEALESGRTIVGTTKAFRGFEEAKALPHVHIADDPVTFRRKIREVLDAPRYCGGTPSEVRARFYWTHLLHDAIVRIERLSG
jgi:hypothetical protein